LPTQSTINIPTQSLSYVPNTKLLLPTYENNPFLVLPSSQSITNTSNAVSSSNENPFNATTPGSLFFNGSAMDSSFITIVGSFRSLTPNFTIETWINYQGNPGQTISLFGSDTSSGDGLIIQLSNLDTIQITSCNGSSGFNTVITFNYKFVRKNWYYIVVIHDGSNTTLFINGVKQGTQGDNNTYSSINTIGGNFVDDIDLINVFSGYIACIRISNTSSIYNTSSDVISVPTQPTSYNESTTIFLMQTYLQNSFTVLPYGIQIKQNNITFNTLTPF